MIDRVTAELGRRLYEVPVGFKWFVAGLLDGSLGFGGEESAGATFLRRDGAVWTTDKDGIIAALLSAEITARMGRDPGRPLRRLTKNSATRSPIASRPRPPPSRSSKLAALSSQTVTATELAGEKIDSIIDHAPGNDAPIGGIKVSRRERLVCRAALGHRGHLQDLRRELSRTGGAAADPQRGASHRRRRHPAALSMRADDSGPHFQSIQETQ